MIFYVYGIDKRNDADAQWRNKRRCARCEIRDIERKRRCGGCPARGNNPIVPVVQPPRPKDPSIC